MADSYNELFGLGSHSVRGSTHAIYKGNDGTSTTLTDSSGNGNNLTWSSAPAAGTTAPAWLTASARDVSGSNQASDATQLLAAFTDIGFAGWFKPNGTASSGPTIAMSVGGSTNGFGLHYRITPNTWHAGVSQSGARTETTGTTDTADALVHVAGTLSGTDLKLYVDGVLEDTATVSAGGVGSNGAGLGVFDGAGISTVPASGRPFEGDGSDLIIEVGNAFTADEVAELKNGPEPLNISAPSVTGTHETGETLSASTGSWDSQSNGTITYTYQWQTATDAFGAGLADISGATSSSFTLTASQEGLYVRCLVRGSNDGGHDAAEDTGSVFTFASAGGGGGPSSTGFPFVIYYRGAACV